MSIHLSISVSTTVSIQLSRPALPDALPQVEAVASAPEPPANELADDSTARTTKDP